MNSKIILLLLPLFLLTGCYETVSEYNARQKLEDRVKSLEKRTLHGEEIPGYRDARCDTPARYEAMAEGKDCNA